VPFLGAGGCVALRTELIKADARAHDTLHITWRYLVGAAVCGIVDGLEGANTWVERTYPERVFCF
jgi:hypothetical protein